MNLSEIRRPFASIFVLFALTACGTSEQTAMVTLVTGLEGASQPINLMDHMRSLKFVGPVSCVQTQVFAGYGPHHDGGPNQIATFPVGLTTPIATDMNVIDTSYTNGVRGWLAASTLKTITLPAPVGVPLDFGILGSLVVSPTANLEGNCPLIPSASAAAMPTYSLIGHATATISGVTNVAVKLWVNNALPTVAQLPLTPTAGSLCATGGSGGGGDSASQLCPNLNFNSVSVICPSCPASFVQFEYFDAINGPQKVHQLYNISSLTAANAVALVPDITPLTVTLLDSSRVAIQKLVYNPDRGGETTGTTAQAVIPYFRDLGTGLLTANYIRVIEGSGVTPPQAFSLRLVEQTLNGIELTWDPSRFASESTVNIASNVNGTFNPVSPPPTPMPGHAVLNFGFNPGSANYFKIVARNAMGAFAESGVMHLTPLVAPATNGSPTGGPGTITISTFNVTGATSYKIHYAVNAPAGSQDPTKYSGHDAANSFPHPTSGIPLGSYQVLIEAINNDGGRVFTVPAANIVVY